MRRPMRFVLILSLSACLGAGASGASMASLHPRLVCKPGPVRQACQCRRGATGVGQVCLVGDACDVRTGACVAPKRR